jgi:hypothetical protein
MKHLWIISLGFFLFLAHASVAQPICDTLPSFLKKQYDTYTPRQFKKIKKQKKLVPIKAFEIATYFRQKGDTVYKQWYALVISQIHKYPYYYGDKLAHKNAPYFAFYYSQACFFTGNYEKAYKWYYRAYEEGTCGSCLDYYYNETKKKLGIMTE